MKYPNDSIIERIQRTESKVHTAIGKKKNHEKCQEILFKEQDRELSLF